MRWAAIMVLAFLPAPAFAAGFDIQVDNFWLDGRIATVVMKVTNNTGKDASSIFIDCAFLDKDQKAIDIGRGLISQIPAGGYAYEKAAITGGERVQFAECQVVRSR